MNKKFHTVYITTNIINGKQYIGDHSTNKLNDAYLESGTYLLRAIKLESKINFKKEILECCATKQEAFDAQEKWIKEYNTLSPNGYNISPKGGHNVKDCFSEESKLKISLNRKGKYSGVDHCNYGKPLADSTKRKIGDKNKINSSGINNPMYGKKLYDIWFNKFGKEEADKKYLELVEKQSKALTGKIRSKETKDKMKIAANNRQKYLCTHCNKMYDKSSLIRHNKKIEKEKVFDIETLLLKEKI